MKNKVKLIILISLTVQLCNAQTVRTVDEYKAKFDAIVPILKLVEKDTSNYIGKPFSEFAKHLEECGAKIIRLSISRHDNYALPQHIYGIYLWFTTNEDRNLESPHGLRFPGIWIHFKGSKPYEKGVSLMREYQASFTKEVEEFYSDAVIESFNFYIPEDIYMPHARRNE